MPTTGRVGRKHGWVHSIVSFPFRLSPTRSLAVVEQESANGYAEQVAATCLTLKGERLLVPGFGLTDATFTLGGLEVAEIRANIEQFGPPVDVDSIETVGDGDRQFVRVNLGESKQAA